MKSSEKPNIILIITDHYAYFGHNEHHGLKHACSRFDEFKSDGVEFNRAYSVCPLCTPARASMMTGVYPFRHGMRWNTESPINGNLRDFKPAQQLYSHYLSKRGYRNAYVGKWHCGHERMPVDYGIEGWSLPDYGKVYMSEEYRKYSEEHGFGEARAYIEHSVNKQELEGGVHILHNPSPWYFMNSSGILEGPPGAHEENFVAHLAVEKIKELSLSEQPWSLVASFWGPHQPYFPSEPYASMIDPRSIPEHPSFRDNLDNRPLRHKIHRDMQCSGTKRWGWDIWQEVLARCYGQAMQTDAAIGAILDSLDELRLSDNTIVIWTSDHGDAIASHGGLWDKSSTYTEEVGRVPLAIRWPSRFKGGMSVDNPVSNMDVTATMLAAAGMSIPEEMDSRSLLSLCSGNENTSWPDHVIFEHNGHGSEAMYLQKIIISGRHKYVAARYEGDELYDLVDDPFGMKNLINDTEYSNVKKELQLKIIEHIEKEHDPFANTLAYKIKADLSV